MVSVPLHSLRSYLPYVATGTVIVVIMIGAYVAVVFSASNLPKGTWLQSPLPLSFHASNGRGGAVDSLTCSRAASGLTYYIHVSKPSVLALNAIPSSFSCNSSPLIVTVTATCLVSATQCRGHYQGLVRIRQPANYRDLPENLQVDIDID